MLSNVCAKSSCRQAGLHAAQAPHLGAVAASVFATNHPHVPHRRGTRCAAAANDPLSQLPQPIAEPLAYGKAFTNVVLRYVTEAAMDAAAELSMQVAEQPKRMREFTEEVQAAAERELRSAGGQQQRLLTASTSASSGQQPSTAGGSIGSSGSGHADLEALVDDLRADIAASRALLQHIRSSGNGTQPQPMRR